MMGVREWEGTDPLSQDKAGMLEPPFELNHCWDNMHGDIRHPWSEGSVGGRRNGICSHNLVKHERGIVWLVLFANKPTLLCCALQLLNPLHYQLLLVHSEGSYSARGGSRQGHTTFPTVLPPSHHPRPYPPNSNRVASLGRGQDVRRGRGHRGSSQL